MITYTDMKACPLCHKGSLVAGGYSNRVRATKYTPTGKRRVKPNLQWAKLPAWPVGRPAAAGSAGRRIKICTNCLKRGKLLLV